MGKILTTIKNFDGGVANDIRDPRKDKCRMVTNFDIASSSRMTPYRDSESGDAAAATKQIRNFALALRTGTTYALYGLGVTVADGGIARISYRDITDLTGTGWSSPTNGDATNGSISDELFVEYYRVLYGYSTGTNKNGFFAYDIANTTFYQDNTVASEVTATNVAQGLVHSKDDILYVPYDNKIAKKDNGAGATPTTGWTLAALTLPAHLKITSICEYGNYLAIGAVPLSGIGNSVVYLWDRDATLTTLSESIDWGTGLLKVLEEVEGYLVGISDDSGLSSAVNRSRVIFRYLLGGRAVKYDELIADFNTDTTFPISKQKIDNRVYFMLKITIDSEIREGVWSFGRSLIEPTFTIIHERTPTNIALTNSVLKNFFVMGEFMFIAYIDVATWYMSKTKNVATYTATSIYEKLFNTVDSQTTKKLEGVSVMFADLPTNAQVVLKYKIDENIPSSTFVTVFTHAVASSIRHTAINDLPQYKEIVFRIESTKGAEITGLKFLEETIDDDLLKI